MYHMEETSREVIFTLFYVVFSVCIIYPPVEFISAGVTIPTLFASLIGSETQQFIQYHIKRSSLMLLVYSLLPAGYFLGLQCFGYQEIPILNFESFGVKNVFVSFIFILPVLALFQVSYWKRDKWKYHPIAVNVSKFCNNNANWLSVASDINREYRRYDKLCISPNPVCKIVATTNWIIKVMPLSIYIAHQSDATLEVIHADTHHYSIDNNARFVQYLNIEVKSSRNGIDCFTIRLNSQDFKNFEDQISRTIDILPTVSFHRTIIDQFIDVFKEVVLNNPRYITDENLETCMGCLQSIANIKLQKFCESEEDPCATCYCKPLWCVNCIAKWFASRQDQEHQETWLSSKCTCPLCRAKFCVLDVCLIDQ